ncbi:MAG: dephospho-CoA kinase [Chitinispirillaceae bacterium]
MRIGIAGYMGSGKSSCASLFCYPQVQIIDGDVEAKKLMQSDSRIQTALISAFGEIKDETGIRFDKLAEISFKSLDSIKILNGIVHPELVKHLRSMILSCSRPVCILDAALIPLWKIESWFDLCIWIDECAETRFSRLKMKRNDLADFELKRRIELQEQLFSVPQEKTWIKLGSGECGEYVRNYLQEHHQDLAVAGGSTK